MPDYEPDFTPVEEDTTPAEQEENTPAETEEGTKPETAPQDEGNADTKTDEAPAADQPDAPAPFLSIKFNHENIDMTEEEVRKTVQIAKKNEALFAELDYLAAQGGETPAEFVKRITKASEDAYLEKLRDKYGDEDEETVNELMELYRSKNKEKYDAVIKARADAAKADEDSLNERMANELIEVQGMFPDVKEFNDLPESVRKAALGGGDLLKEYLKYRHSEDAKVQKNKEAESKAQSAASGSVKSPEQTEDSAENTAFMRGFWGT